MNNTLNVEVKRLSPAAALPYRANPADAGSDLFTVHASHLVPGAREIFRTGIALAIPEGYVGLIMPRSGLALNSGIDVLGGVIDSGYRGEVGVILLNTGRHSVPIMAGERIAQLVIQPVMNVHFASVLELDESERGEGGFGSTGTS